MLGLLGLDCTSSRRAAAAKAKPKNEGGLQLASHLQRRAAGTRTQLTRVHMVVIRVFCHGVINIFLLALFLLSLLHVRLVQMTDLSVDYKKLLYNRPSQ